MSIIPKQSSVKTMTSEMRVAIAAAVDEVLKNNRVSLLADKLGITPTAIYRWTQVPANRVLDVEALTGIPRGRLRPDMYGPAKECERLPQQHPRLVSRVDKLARRVVL